MMKMMMRMMVTMNRDDLGQSCGSKWVGRWGGGGA